MARVAATCPGVRRLTTGLVLLVTLVLAAGGPAHATAAADDRWSPPDMSSDARFPTSVVRWSDGTTSTQVIPASQLPLRMVVEREVADVLGTDAVARGVAGWNGIRGSRFSATLKGMVNDRVRRPTADGVHRIFLDTSCSGEELAWAYTNKLTGGRRHGMVGAYTVDGDIGVCRNLLHRPSLAASTIRHEIGHLMGLGHVDAPCRVMSARNGNCDAMTAGEHDAARYMYARLPRLSGPTRFETSARSVYATHRSNTVARTVVLVDGTAGSELPVTAAALAGAIGAPMLLSDHSCLDGAAGTELVRVAAPGSSVLLVGPAVAGCATALRSRGYEPVALPSPSHVADRFPRDLDTVFVVRGALPDGNLPDGLTAATAAARLGAPILLTDGQRLSAWSDEFLRIRPNIVRAVVVGGSKAVPDAVLDRLRGRGVRTERVWGSDRIATALAVANIPGAFPARGPVVVASAQAWPDAVAGSALGGSGGWPVVLTPKHALDERVGRFLSERATSGFVMGGRQVITDQTMVTISARAR